MCNLYELLYRNKYALNNYIKFYTTTILQLILKNNEIEINKNQKLVKEIAEAVIASTNRRELVAELVAIFRVSPIYGARSVRKLVEICKRGFET